jgi:hypothetical protein
MFKKVLDSGVIFNTGQTMTLGSWNQYESDVVQ